MRSPFSPRSLLSYVRLMHLVGSPSISPTSIARLAVLGIVGGAASIHSAGCSATSAVESTGSIRSALTPQALLNELKVNPPSIDQPYEFAEVQCTPSATLSNLYFISMEGDAGNNGPGTADLVIPLDGVVCGSNGLVLIKATTGGNTPADAATTVVTNAAFDTSGSGMENGTNSFLLVESATAIVQTTDYDLTDSGTLTLPTGAVVLDAVGWTDGGTGDIIYGAALTQSTGEPQAASRFPADATPTSAPAWYCGSLTGTTADSVVYSATAHSATFPVGGVVTPGAVNVGVPSVPDAGVDAGGATEAGVDAGRGGILDDAGGTDATLGADTSTGGGSDDAAPGDDGGTLADDAANGPDADDAGSADDASQAPDAAPGIDASDDASVEDAGAPGDAGDDAADGSVNAPADLVISQVYGGGGNSGAVYSRDFVELFNRGASDVALDGLAIMYGGGTRDFGTLEDGGAPDTFALPASTLRPGEYFLIGLSSTSATGAALPTVDGDGTIAVGATNGKIALVVGAAPLGCGGVSGRCGSNPRIVDIVGFGTGTDYEGTAATGALSNTTAAIRKTFGCVDTKQNSSDFTVGTPTPRNSESSEIDCANPPDASTPAPDAGSGGGADAGSNDAGGGLDAGTDAGGGHGGGVDSGSGGGADSGGGGTVNPDAGGSDDAGGSPGDDAGSAVSDDAGGVSEADAATGDDGGSTGDTGATSGGGCSCKTAGGAGGGGGGGGALAALAVVFGLGGLSRRRRARRD